MAVEIGERLAIMVTIASPTRSQGYKVNGVPEYLRVTVYRGDEGWYFSAHATEHERPPYKKSMVKPLNHFFASRDEALKGLRQYLRAYFLD